MFKVSFRDFDGPSKKVQTFNDKATVVTLKGRMVLPDWWYNIPSDILDWVRRHPSVDAWESLANNELVIVVQGKTTRSDKDENNPVLAERIAESKAKIKIYKFLHTLLKKLCDHYGRLLLGYTDFMPTSNVENGLYTDLAKYEGLWIKESHHLGKLMEES